MQVIQNRTCHEKIMWWICCLSQPFNTPRKPQYQVSLVPGVISNTYFLGSTRSPGPGKCPFSLAPNCSPDVTGKFMLTAYTWIFLSPTLLASWFSSSMPLSREDVPPTSCACWYRQVVPNKEFLSGRQVLLLGQLRPGANSRLVITTITARSRRVGNAESAKVQGALGIEGLGCLDHQFRISLGVRLIWIKGCR